MSDFTIGSYDMATLGTSPFFSIPCKVKGYWSRESITVYCTRSYLGKDDGEWRVDLFSSSGGRDTGEVADDAEAVRYFAKALVAMADLVETLRDSIDTLEANYQAERRAYKEAAEREKAVRQEAIDKDAPLGEQGAKELVKSLLVAERATANVYERGSDRPAKVSIVTRGNSTFYIGERRTSKASLLEFLAKASARSHILA